MEKKQRLQNERKKDVENIKAENIRNKVFTGFIWSFLERFGAQLVTFVVQIILARLLEPNVYGLVALVVAFTNILQVFVDSGLGNALIQKKNADDIDFSTVFYFNIIMCLCLYSGIFMVAPLIASFYGNDLLTPVIRVMSLSVIISGLKNVQHAYVAKKLLFKRFFYATLCGTIGAAMLGIVMAYLGFGIWALVVQNLFNIAVDTLVLWIMVKWRPQKVFSMERLKELIEYGWKISMSSFLNTGYNEIRQLIIGRSYSAVELAYYNRGSTFPSAIVTNVDTTISNVLFPTLSQRQDEKGRVREITSRAIKISTFVMAPLMMGLAFASETIVRVILTDKWLPCVPYLCIFCVTYMFYPISTANINAIKAIGRSDLILKLEVLKLIIGIVALLLTFKISVMAMAYSLLVTSILGQIINSWPNKKILQYGYLQQLKDVFPSITASVIMGFLIYWIKWLPLHRIIVLIIQTMVGGFIYLIIVKIGRNDSLDYIIFMIKNLREKGGSSEEVCDGP